MRVMSLKPPAARRSSAPCSSARSLARPISVAVVRCGTWLIHGYDLVVALGRQGDDIGPELGDHRGHRANVVSAVAVFGVSTQTAPLNIPASAPSRPSNSDPAIGWPPTNRGSSTSAAIEPFTDPVSVTRPVVLASARRTCSAMAMTVWPRR